MMAYDADRLVQMMVGGVLASLVGSGARTPEELRTELWDLCQNEDYWQMLGPALRIVERETPGHLAEAHAEATVIQHGGWRSGKGVGRG